MTIEATLTKQPATAEPAMKVAVTSAKTPDYVEGRRTSSNIAISASPRRARGGCGRR